MPLLLLQWWIFFLHMSFMTKTTGASSHLNSSSLVHVQADGGDHTLKVGELLEPQLRVEELLIQIDLKLFSDYTSPDGTSPGYCSTWIECLHVTYRKVYTISANR